MFYVLQWIWLMTNYKMFPENIRNGASRESITLIITNGWELLHCLYSGAIFLLVWWWIHLQLPHNLICWCSKGVNIIFTPSMYPPPIKHPCLITLCMDRSYCEEVWMDTLLKMWATKELKKWKERGTKLYINPSFTKNLL